MNSAGSIYSAPDDTIPAEDKARLDGYLRGRDDAARLDDAKAAMRAERDALLKEVAK